jgi:hypothetical protein
MAKEYLDINEITGAAEKNRSKSGIKQNSSKEQLRTLTQYRNLTDEEFDEVWNKRQMGISKDKFYEERIKAVIDKMKEEYDFSDLKPNDWNQVRVLAQLQIDVDDLNLMLYQQRTKVDDDGKNTFDAGQYKVLSQTRDSIVDRISAIQNDLQITRRVRRNDEATSVIDEIQKMKEAAKRFTDVKMKKIICPKCGRWVASLWLLHFGATKNILQVQCQTTLEDGSKCGEIIKFTGKDLAEMKSSNREELLPVTLR